MVKKLVLFCVLLLPFASLLQGEEAPAPVAATTMTAPTPAANTKPKETPAPEEDDSDMMLPSPSASVMPEHNYSRQFIATLVAIIIVVFLVLLIIWFMRRFTNNRPLHMNHRKHIKVLERRPLSPNTYVYLLQVGDKQFILAESKFHVQNVATFDWNETTPDL